MSDPNRISELLNQIDALIAEGEFKKTGTLFEEILTSYPNHPPTLRKLAECMLKLDQHTTALALLADSIDPEKPDAETVLKISRILNSVNRTDEAAEFLFGCCQAEPSNKELLEEAKHALKSVGRDSDIEFLENLAKQS